MGRDSASKPSANSEDSFYLAIPLDWWNVWKQGLLDALALRKCLAVFFKSEVVRYRTLQCIILNGVIFLGSIVLFNYALSPLLAWLMPVEGVHVVFAFLYKVLWLYPIYCISFILNTVAYQDIADHSQPTSYADKPKTTSLQSRVIDEIFRIILNLNYIVLLQVLYYVLPSIVGGPVYFCGLCWLAALYVFEYRWVHLGWNSQERLTYLEHHWLYFLGFGFPIGFMSFMSPKFIEAGLFAVIFPLLIVTGARAKPSQTKRVENVPIFYGLLVVTTIMLSRVEKKMRAYKYAPET